MVQILNTRFSPCRSDTRSLANSTSHPTIHALSSPSCLAVITPQDGAIFPDNCPFSFSPDSPNSYQPYSLHAAAQYLHHPQPVYWNTVISDEPCHSQQRSMIYPACADQDSARTPRYQMEATSSHQPIHSGPFQHYSSDNNNAVIRDIWSILR